MNISVAMAVYNGQMYLKEQIDSILRECQDADELILSIDPSTDDSESIIQSYSDPRIRLVQGPGQGAVANFENAIRHCRNDIIFLSDQDDIWMPGKRNKVLAAFEKETMVVLHDAIVVDDQMHCIYPSFFEHRGCRLGIPQNILKNSYIGCCMAFRKELVPVITPFPKNLPMHDQWIGLCGEKLGHNKLIHEPLLIYRRHEENASAMEHADMVQMIQWRFYLIKHLKKIQS